MNNECLKNVFIYQNSIKRIDREKKNKHKSYAIWFTGLSGSGKSSISNEVEKYLFKKGKSTYLLDGDNIRSGLCSDLKFNSYDRTENIRRTGEVVKLMLDAGILVLVAVISPYKKDRSMVCNLLGKKNFLEIFVDTPLHICERRDPKQLYKNARLGKINHFTGIQSIYEKPEKPDVYLDGTDTLEQNTKKVIKILYEYNAI